MGEEPLNHPVVWMEFGPVIALADTVALKMGTLHDRALPRDVLDAYGASFRFTRTELIAACRAALDEEFSLETLRDQLAFASTYPDEAFTRYGARPELIAEVKAWALSWSQRCRAAGPRVRSGLPCSAVSRDAARGNTEPF